jgi:hypothetical protein
MIIISISVEFGGKAVEDIESLEKAKTLHCALSILPVPLGYLRDTNEEIISKPRLVQLQNAIVDPRYMPDRKINSMLLFLHQNNGAFPKRRREQFKELTDVGIERMQKAYREVFKMDCDKMPEIKKSYISVTPLLVVGKNNYFTSVLL